MSWYRLIRPLVHALPAEYAHCCGLALLKHGLMPKARLCPSPLLSIDCLGKSFVHPLGLAAGFDKNAEAVAALLAQGFSFVEVGTVTPKPQAGNSSPRIFRLKEDQAVINRLGFNNDGLMALMQALEHRPKQGIIGINIGKNKDSEDAGADYVLCLEKTYPQADYITVNISSPNTHGLRSLQKRDALTELLTALMARRGELRAHYQKTVPLLLKIAPDLDEEDLRDVCNVSMELGIDGLIISNTTIKRPRTLKSAYHGEQGGLSGAPLFALSTEILSAVYRLTEGKIPLIGVGGVSSAEDCYRKIRAGATLVQLYTAIIYQGFGIVADIVDGLPALLARDGFSTIREAVGADHR